MPTPVDLRKACYAILDLARAEKDGAVKRVLAAHAFSLAQEAQFQQGLQDGAVAPRAAQ